MKNAQSYFSEGLAFQEAGQFELAITNYRKGLVLAPQNPDALFLLGQSLFDGGQQQEGEVLMRQAMAYRPEATNYQAGYAMSLLKASLFSEAARVFVRVLESTPDNPQMLQWATLAHAQAGCLEDALALAERWVVVCPDSADAVSMRQAIGSQWYFDLGESLAKRDLVEPACEAYEKALLFNPQAGAALVNLANLKVRLNQKPEAYALFEQAISLNAEDCAVHFNLAMLYLEDARRLDALLSLEKAHMFSPEDGLIAAHLLFQKMHLCLWDGIDELWQKVADAIENNLADIPPFIILAAPKTTAQLQRKCAENHSARLAQINEGSTEPSIAKASPRASHQRLKVGYLSSDFKNHATAFLMIEMLEAHDREHFEIFALSYGQNDGSAMRARLEASVEHFVELNGDVRAQVLEKIAALKLDILIDLKGFTEGNHSEWLQYRLAPIQINWLGYPGTLGNPWTDYIIADSVVAPMAHQWMFSEKIVHLPGCYQPNSKNRPIGIASTRSQEGLPEDAIVLCSFNQTYKITPEMFDLWLDVLLAVPETVLWLWASNPWAEQQLRLVAEQKGVASSRIIFAEGKKQSEHLARLHLADLALDTYPCNGHTTTSDALWAGVPVVTQIGECFASRVAASLLLAGGLAELVALDALRLKEVIISFCTDQQLRCRLKQQTTQAKWYANLFDATLFARQMEALWQELPMPESVHR